MMCDICLEMDWHRTWCDNHPVNMQNSEWPPALQVATPTGEWLNQMSQRQTGAGNPSKDVMDNVPLIGLLSLGTGISMGESVPPMYTTDEDEQQNNDQER
jgi:hypothetical protein